MTTVIKFLFAQALISSRQLGVGWMRMRSLLQPQLVQLGRLQVLDKALELGVDALDVVVDNLHSQEQMAWSGKVKVLCATVKSLSKLTLYLSKEHGHKDCPLKPK